jgi:hypothetical protein
LFSHWWFPCFQRFLYEFKSICLMNGYLSSENKMQHVVYTHPCYQTHIWNSVCLNTNIHATALNSLNQTSFKIRVCWEVTSCNLE